MYTAGQTLFQHAKRWLLRDLWATIRLFLSALAAMIGLWGVVTKSADLFFLTRSTQGLDFFHQYLWVSFTTSIIGLGLLWAFLDGMWKIRNEVRGKYQQALVDVDTVAKIHHNMSEAVRRYVLEFAKQKSEKPSPNLDAINDDSKLQDALGADLSEYLKSQLGELDVSVSVKFVVPQLAGTPEPSLQAVFRYDPGKRKKSRPRAMRQSESLVFTMFCDAENSKVKRVVIRDTHKLETDVTKTNDKDVADSNAKYRKYADECEFRSVLAFPLREPIPRGSAPTLLELTPVRGFLSFDSKKPNAFDNLFNVKQDVSADNDGSHLEDTGKLQLFFGLADSLASIAVIHDLQPPP